ncbi:VOC family protein [Chenggangzhangella methanolivorans]|uniref:VOC family protein n=1 Tax=Chenggangzhangella methanolivorans TaxID=1437009 RepID=A0A9E6RDM2_9HYPH|nr:VOC family protein [Chenggangzhangella methanolivorans]QZN98851.1 VOC family protein [Chenggangzhangella methanolivorans]
MQQQMSVVTLGVVDLARSKRFYVEGFGWRPVFENDEIVFYQMNGFVLGTWAADRLAEDARRAAQPSAGFSLGHNVADRDDVESVMSRLAKHGGVILRPADEPPHGGCRGYLADPDGHVWEIAWNPAFPISSDGHVAFGL